MLVLAARDMSGGAQVRLAGCCASNGGSCGDFACLPLALPLFGADDDAHPAVNYLHNQAGKVYLGGPVTGIQQPIHYDFRGRRDTPNELRLWVGHWAPEGLYLHGDTARVKAVNGRRKPPAVAKP